VAAAAQDPTVVSPLAVVEVDSRTAGTAEVDEEESYITGALSNLKMAFVNRSQ